MRCQIRNWICTFVWLIQINLLCACEVVQVEMGDVDSLDSSELKVEVCY